MAWPLRPELQQFFVWVEPAVLRSVMERNVRVSTAILEINFAGIERLGIDMDGHGALCVLHRVNHCVYRLGWIHVTRMVGIHIQNIGWNNLAGAASGIALIDAIVLHAQPPYRRGHPAILAAVIVDAALLANFPADGHALKYGVL